MLTAHCSKAADLSFLQINELAYYFPKCLLAQLTLWGTSNLGMNTVWVAFANQPVLSMCDGACAASFLMLLYGTLYPGLSFT